MKVMIADTETGGLDENKQSLLSVGFVIGDLTTGEIFEKYEKYVKHDSYVISEKSFEVHGITEEYCHEHGVPPQQIADAMSDSYINNNCELIGGHNFQFDVRWMSKHLFETDGTGFNSLFTHRHLDSFPICQMFNLSDKKVTSGNTLTSWVKYFKIDMSDFKGKNSHNALYDSAACFRVSCEFRKCIEKIPGL